MVPPKEASPLTHYPLRCIPQSQGLRRKDATWRHINVRWRLSAKCFLVFPPDSTLPWAPGHWTSCGPTMGSITGGLPAGSPLRGARGTLQEERDEGRVLIIPGIPSLPGLAGGLCPSAKGHSSHQDIGDRRSPAAVTNIRKLSPHPLMLPGHGVSMDHLSPAKIFTESGNQDSLWKWQVLFSTTTVSPSFSLLFPHNHYGPQMQSHQGPHNSPALHTQVTDLFSSPGRESIWDTCNGFYS